MAKYKVIVNSFHNKETNTLHSKGDELELDATSTTAVRGVFERRLELLQNSEEQELESLQDSEEKEEDVSIEEEKKEKPKSARKAK